MSRMSMRTFLVSARRALNLAIRNNSPASFVVGNESADLDSITCALVYGYIHSSTLQARRAGAFTIPITNIQASDLPLRPELTALLKHAGVEPKDLITLDDLNQPPPQGSTWTLVDHNVLTGTLGEHNGSSITAVIDHHQDENTVSKTAKPRIVETSGSCSSLVVNACRDTWDTISSYSSSVGAANGQDQGIIDDTAYTSTWDAQVAKLALASILIDTVNLTAESKVTDHDRKAVKYLEAKINASPRLGKDYDRNIFYKEINDAKSDLDGLTLDDILRKDYKQWTEGGMKLGMSSAVRPIDYLQDKVDDFVNATVSFAKDRNLQLYAIMTAYTSEQGEFARELLLLAPDDGKAVTAAERFVADHADKLELKGNKLDTERDDRDSPSFLKFWTQGDLSASRKKVGPMLRKAMV